MSITLETPKMATPRTPKGEGTDREILEVIEQRPGLSKYELAHAVGWSMGKTDGAVKRLVDRKLVYLMVLERDGRRVNLIYPAGYVEPDYIGVRGEKVPVNVVSAFVYALNSASIGVSWENNVDWEKLAFRTSRVAIESSKGRVTFKLPEDFRWFYGFDHKHHVVSIVKGGLLITVSGELRKA